MNYLQDIVPILILHKILHYSIIVYNINIYCIVIFFFKKRFYLIPYEFNNISLRSIKLLYNIHYLFYIFIRLNSSHDECLTKKTSTLSLLYISTIFTRIHNAWV